MMVILAVLVAVVIPGSHRPLSKDSHDFSVGRSRNPRKAGWWVKATSGWVLWNVCEWAGALDTHYTGQRLS